MPNPNLSVQSLFDAASAADTNGSMKGISYTLTHNNTLDNEWWVFIPYGKWANRSIPAPMPKPSPLEEGFIRTVQAAGNGPLFIDITHLSGGAFNFGQRVAPALMEAINNASSVVIRYLQGDAEGTAAMPPYDGIVANLFSRQKQIKPKNAWFYYGGYSPSVQLPAGDGATATDLTDQICGKLIGLLMKGLREVTVLDHVVEQLQENVESWTKRFLGMIRIPQVSWNHSKIVAVNGTALMTGGGNYWNEYTDYQDLVFDLQMRIQGDAAVAAHQMCNYMWTYLANKPASDTTSVSLGCSLHDPVCNFKPAQAPMFLPEAGNAGGLAALSVGNIGNFPGVVGVPVLPINAVRDLLSSMVGALSLSLNSSFDFGVVVQEILGDGSPLFQEAMRELGISPAAWSSRATRNLAIGRCESVLRLAQQKFVLDDLMDSSPEFQALVQEFNKATGAKWDGYLWPYDTMIALGTAVVGMGGNPTAEGVQVITSYFAQNEGYQNPIHDAEFLQKLTAILNTMVLRGMAPFLDDAHSLVDRLVSCKRIWPNTDHGCHCKLVVADDAVVFVGSDNAYPAYCEEHGLWIDDATAITDLLQHYWDGLWGFARKEEAAHAVSGSC